MTAETLLQIRRDEQQRQSRLKDRILCCSVAGCLSCGGEAVRSAIAREIAKQGRTAEVEVCGTGCLGLCSEGPLVRSRAADAIFTRVTPEDAPAIAAGTAELPDRTLGPGHPFFAGQRRIILANSGITDPERLPTTSRKAATSHCCAPSTEMTPRANRRRGARSGLRGRGGAGYPAGLKWELVARQPSATKYVVCNADEGDPGAFMNRSVLEGDPHRVLEGMAIAGRAVGAQQGIFTPAASPRWPSPGSRTAIEQARREGFSAAGFSRRTSISASICASAPAPMSAVKKRRCWPPSKANAASPCLVRLIRRSRACGKADAINNVETFANIPAIIAKGGEWFAVHRRAGKPRHESLCAGRQGAARRTGRSSHRDALRTILYDFGGGVPEGYEFKAAQTGGPAGGCIPARYLDLPMDYDSLTEHRRHDGLRRTHRDGYLVLHGGLARFFMEFCMDESCGKCVPCRAGTVQMHGILARITRGEGAKAIFAMFGNCAGLLRATSLCGLGLAAPNPGAEHACGIFATNTRRTCASAAVPPGMCHTAVPTPGRQPHERPDSRGGRPRPSPRWRAKPSSPPHGTAAFTFPRLCHVGGLSDSAPAACVWSRSKAEKAAAFLPDQVAEEMVVRTDTPALRRPPQAHRRTAVRRAQSCLFGLRRRTALANCRISPRELGVDHIRLRPQYPQLRSTSATSVSARSQPLYSLHPLCARLRRSGGRPHLGCGGTGRNPHVITDLGEPWGESDTCTGCGKCVQVCPTGALFLKGKTVAEMHKDRASSNTSSPPGRRSYGSPEARRPLATAWLGGCSGCHMSFLDLDERLIELAGLVDICYSPSWTSRGFRKRWTSRWSKARSPTKTTCATSADPRNTTDPDRLRRLRRDGNVTALRNLFPLGGCARPRLPRE